MWNMPVGVTKLIIISAIYIVLVPPTAFADTIILRTGEIIETKQAWKKDQKVYFYIDELKLSVSVKEVLRIEKKSVKSNTTSHVSDPPKPPPPEAIERSTKNNYSDKKNHSSETILPSTPQKEIQDSRKSYGFRDLPWGTELVALTDFVKLETDSGIRDVKEYKRKNDKLTLGRANLQSIVYAFWRDQFFTVTIWAEGEENYHALRDYSINQFGNNYHDDKTSQKYLWSNTLTDVMLKYDENEQIGVLWMRSKKIDRLHKLTKLNVPSSYRKWTKSHH